MALDADLVSLSNQALARFAGGVIGIDDESPLANLCSQIAGAVVDARLTHQAWSFASFTFLLARDDTQDWKAGHAYAFRQPGERLMGPIRLAPAAAPDARVRDFALENDFVFCSEEAVYGTYIMRPPLEQWPPAFREAIVVILAEALALAVTQKLDLAQQFHMAAFGPPSMGEQGGLWGRWVKSEAQQGGLARQPAGRASLLIAARMGGGRLG